MESGLKHDSTADLYANKGYEVPHICSDTSRPKSERCSLNRLSKVDRKQDGTIKIAPCKYEATWHNYKV
jgi:hypothetical protein